MTERSSKTPRLSIVIPTLNRSHCVGRAVESALSQTFSDIEIIVSNNGSIDNTREVLERYCDPRLRIIHREQTIPADAHGNFLIMQAKGEFFLALSDDDYLEPGFVSRVIDLFDRSPDVSFVYTRCLRHYENILVPTPIAPEVENGTEFVTAFLAGLREICWCACVTRTRDLRDIGPIPEGIIFGDFFYWTKLIFKGNVGFVSDLLSHYIFMGDNLSAGVPVLAWAEEMRILVNDMVAGCIAQAKPDESFARQLRQDGASFLARTTANQFVWCALRGFTKPALFHDLRRVCPYIRGDQKKWVRVIAALVLPRSFLRKLILMSAKLMATKGTSTSSLP